MSDLQAISAQPPPAPITTPVAVPDLGYWKSQIRCQAACPVHTDARGYVRAIAAGEDELAYLIARGPNPLASICGRVCGAPCEKECRRGNIDRPVSIRALKRWACESMGPAIGEANGSGLIELLRQAAVRYRQRACVGGEDLLALLQATLEGRVPLAEGASAGIIGSGPAGLAAAHDLALLGFDGHPMRQIARLYRDGGLTGTIGNTFIPVPLGKAVGGTTIINSGTCWRLSPERLRAWGERFAIPGLKGEGLDREYDRIESDISVAPVAEEFIGVSARAFRRGAEALGFRGSAIRRNARDCRGTGVCALGCPRGAKQSTERSYVPRALCAGARLYVRTRADRVLTTGAKTEGLAATALDPRGRPGGVLRIRAPRVVVAAGAMHTPRLLAQSGVGNRAHLGRHLHLHPAARVLAVFNEELRAWEGVPQSYHVHEFEDQGIFIQGMALPPGAQAAHLPGFGHAHKRRMAEFPHLASFGALISDESSGRVALKGPPGLVWYWMGRRDRQLLLRGISLVARIFLAAGAREVLAPVRGYGIVDCEEATVRLEGARIKAADIESMAFHPMGTARMGGDPKDSVIDPRGQVHGVEGFYVAAASLFPSSLGTNPQLTIMAFALRIAGGMLEGV